jgi:outer membrane biosynthesis protein TonB
VCLAVSAVRPSQARAEGCADNPPERRRPGEQLISRITPTYPQIARVARVSGIVELTVLVGRDGRVLSVQVLSGSPLLATAAKQAVEQWR